MGIYQWLERSLFNSLTRKLCGNFIFLILIQLVAALLFWVGASRLKSFALGAVDVEVMKGVETVARLLSIGFWLCLFSIAAMITSMLFLRFLIVRPIRQLSLQSKSMATDDADLSKELHVSSFDELADLAENYNQVHCPFAENDFDDPANGDGDCCQFGQGCQQRHRFGRKSLGAGGIGESGFYHQRCSDPLYQCNLGEYANNLKFNFIQPGKCPRFVSVSIRRS